VSGGWNGGQGGGMERAQVAGEGKGDGVAYLIL
jgi:hypothetical protein